MTKTKTIVVSILLIISAILIKVLLKDSNTILDVELVGFFSGILLGYGIATLLSALFRKKVE